MLVLFLKLKHIFTGADVPIQLCIREEARGLLNLNKRVLSVFSTISISAISSQSI